VIVQRDLDILQRLAFQVRHLALNMVGGVNGDF
jgi:hypothetical protein